MWHPVILVQLQPKRAGWFQLVACTHWFLHLAATVEALCATAHFLRVFSGSLMNPPNRQKLWDDFNRSCILLPRLLPKSCRHNERFLSALVRLLFQAYLVLYRPKQGGRQGTAWRSSTLQDVRQNPSPALKESPRMGTEFGCKICMLCADSSPKTWHGPRFPRQIGADLCGLEHLAKKPFPQSTVFLAKQARTCADPSLQKPTADHGFVGKAGADLRGP